MRAWNNTSMDLGQNSVEALLIGVASSLLATVAVGLGGAQPEIVGLTASAGLIMISIATWRLRERFRVLKSMGVVDWERSMSDGTTTDDCIKESQTSVRFLGIASTKWLADPVAFRRMLQRRATNGGHAHFLLLDPDSAECRRFESIKNMPAGTLSRHTRQNAQALLRYRAEHFRIEVRFYRTEPRFRLAIRDEQVMLFGLYSFTTDSGDDSPQLVLDSAKLPGSFYYAMNAYFAHLWNNAAPVGAASPPLAIHR